MLNTLALLIGLIINALLMLALGFSVLLNANNFDYVLEQSLQARAGIVLGNVRRVLEHSLDLGTELGTIEGVGEMIDRQSRNDPDILSLEVFDREGVVLLGTDRSYLRQQIPLHWQRAWARSDADQLWQLAERDALVAGLALRDSTGSVMGGVVLRYARSELIDQGQQLLRTMLVMALLLVCGLAVLVTVATLGLLRPLERLSRHMRTDLHQLSAEPDPTLPAAYRPMRQALLDVEAALDRCERDIERIDTMD